MGLSQPALLSSKILIQTERKSTCLGFPLQHAVPAAEAELCSFKMVLYRVSETCVLFIFSFRMCCCSKQGLISFPWVGFLSSSHHPVCPWFVSFVKKSKHLIQQLFFFSKMKTFIFIWILIPTLKLWMLASILDGLLKNYFKIAINYRKWFQRLGLFGWLYISG